MNWTRTVERAHSPTFTAKGTVTLMVKFAEVEGELPFHAMPTDPEPHGVDIYNRAIAGEFGEVAAYVAPPEPPPPTKEQVLRKLVRSLTPAEFAALQSGDD